MAGVRRAAHVRDEAAQLVDGRPVVELLLALFGRRRGGGGGGGRRRDGGGGARRRRGGGGGLSVWMERVEIVVLHVRKHPLGRRVRRFVVARKDGRLRLSLKSRLQFVKVERAKMPFYLREAHFDEQTNVRFVDGRPFRLFWRRRRNARHLHILRQHVVVRLAAAKAQTLKIELFRHSHVHLELLRHVIVVVRVAANLKSVGNQRCASAVMGDAPE